MAQMQKIQYMISGERKFWKLFKGILYLFSLGVMVFAGYSKESPDSLPANDGLEGPVEQRITQDYQYNDSLYYASDEIGNISIGTGHDHLFSYFQQSGFNIGIDKPESGISNFSRRNSGRSGN